MFHLFNLPLVCFHAPHLVRDRSLLFFRLQVLDLFPPGPLVVKRRERGALGLRHVGSFLRQLGRLLGIPQLQVVELLRWHRRCVVVLDVLFEQVLHLHLSHCVRVFLLDFHRPEKEFWLLGKEVLSLDDAVLAELIGHGIACGAISSLIHLLSLPLGGLLGFLVFLVLPFLLLGLRLFDFLVFLLCLVLLASLLSVLVLVSVLVLLFVLPSSFPPAH
mmetsp:Transcript_61241/g.162799  ORF Transcript_61241/g.162799 Transcript_61241/m.162799 type:complete len:217 (+) Transcript_61241:196-846(+)